MVYYRKYRPQTIEELDLDSVRERLTSILSAKELPHAFLFTGPKGLGKTSSARILAKAISCERVSRVSKVSSVSKGNKTPDTRGTLDTPDTLRFEPCNKCDNCVSITNGSNIDVLEIDAASNRGIDEIRDLREKIKFSPASLPRKVYIIDEVHMLTTDAFNALLKTLEEPPAHAVFILCTTEVEKVPATIASRTFHVEFRKPTKEEISRSLERIVVGEKIQINKEVLERIHKLSENSFRDAAKILEELVISSKEGKITTATLENVYKSAGSDSILIELLKALSKKDSAGALRIVDNLAQKGADFKVVTERLAEILHSVLMIRAGIPNEGEDFAELEIGDAQNLLSKLNESYRDIKFSVLPQLPLELVVIGWCLESQKTEDGPPTQQLQKPQQPEPSQSEIANSDPRPFDSAQGRLATSEKDHGALFNVNSKPDSFLVALIDNVKRDNHSIAGILRGCTVGELKGDSVVLETKYKFHKDRLSEAKVSEILDLRAGDILREKVHVVVNLMEK